MNLSVENIHLAVKQAGNFMKANGADSEQQLDYRLILEDLLLEYRKLYGEETAFRLVLRRKWKTVVLSLRVACESRNLLLDHASVITRHLLDNISLGLSWSYSRHENVITCSYTTPMMDYRSIRYIWQYMRDERSTFLGAVALRFVNMGLSVLEPLLSAWIVVAYSGAEIRKIMLLALLILGQGALRSSINYAASRLLRRSYAVMLKRMQTDLAERILRIRTERMDKTGSGVFSKRLLSDTAGVVDGIDDLLGTFTEAFHLVSLLICYLVVSPTMFFFELALFTAYFLIQRAHSKSLQQNGRETSVADDRHSGFVSEMVRAHRDIKLLHCEDSFMDRFSESVRESVDLASKMRRRSMNFILLRSQFISWTSFAYMGLLALMMVKYGMTPSTALVLFIYNGKVYTCAWDLANLMKTAYSLGLSVERIYQLMNSPDYEWEKFGSGHIGRVRGDLEMRNVHFTYRQQDGKENKVLNGVSLKIHAGESVALVGRSGCGKTTILSLFSRLYDPDSGEILIDGVPVETLDQETVRGSITMVSQMPYLFNMSIRDNLALVKKDMTDAEMLEACRIACIHDDIMALPDGYDTVVGEGGVQLSGGQRQRLALARSLLRDSPVIMLDEATSALDNVTQSEVTRAIENMRGSRTIIMVAHRLSTVIGCERLFFISEGRVLASGTHRELMAGCEEYRSLYGEEDRAARAAGGSADGDGPRPHG